MASDFFFFLVVEGAVYAMCMTGQDDQGTLAQWISGLQETNPVLGKIPTVFRLDAGFREVQRVEDVRHDSGQNQHSGAEEEHIVEEEVSHSQGMKQWLGHTQWRSVYSSTLVKGYTKSLSFGLSIE